MGNEESHQQHGRSASARFPRPQSSAPVNRKKMGNQATSSSNEEDEMPTVRRAHSTTVAPQIVTDDQQELSDEEERARRAASQSPRRKSKYKALGALAVPGNKPTESSARRKSELKPFTLTQIQIKQIQRLWASVINSKGMSYPGSMIFEKIFMKEPKAKEVFSATGNNYRYHFLKVSETIDFLVKNISDMDEMATKLEEIGQMHTSFRSAGFHPRLWDTFAEAMISSTVLWGNKNQRTPETQKGWTKIVLLIIDRMRDGYHKKLRKNSVYRNVLSVAVPIASTSNQLDVPGMSLQPVGEQGGRSGSLRDQRTISIDQSSIPSSSSLTPDVFGSLRRKSTY